ncbi:MAG: NAD(P)-dependent oxidoreductase, partial [Flavobacteriales bacterium]
TGMENIDVKRCKEKGIQCFNAPEGNRTAVAEHILGMLLGLFNNLYSANDEVRKGIWQRERNRGIQLDGKTIGIIGLGNTGSAFARKLKGFETEILVYDKYKENTQIDHVKNVDLQELQENSDIISFHVPLNKETEYYFNEEFLSAMNKEFYLINSSRGKIVNTKVLVKGLESGKIKGACLDVLEQEGSSFEKINREDTFLQKLLSFDNVILSPHIAGWSNESYKILSEVLADKIGGISNND